MQVAVCDYGAGNIRSIISALRRHGDEVTLSASAEHLEHAALVVLPGVGSARSAMETLRGQGLDVVLRQRAAAGRPILGICLGLQLAFESSDEDGGVEGLGILPGQVRRLQGRHVPRMGWARVDPWNDAYYFAHSYAAETPAAVATSDGIVAAAAEGSFLGVQFHPEKSGPAGERFLSSYLEQVTSRRGAA
ncbi:MAG: imidazole glycerol phosphate synthase subunit HisH [Candidatus Dormibacteria bacterium]